MANPNDVWAIEQPAPAQAPKPKRPYVPRPIRLPNGRYLTDETKFVVGHPKTPAANRYPLPLTFHLALLARDLTTDKEVWNLCDQFCWAFSNMKDTAGESTVECSILFCRTNTVPRRTKPELDPHLLDACRTPALWKLDRFDGKLLEKRAYLDSLIELACKAGIRITQKALNRGEQLGYTLFEEDMPVPMVTASQTPTKGQRGKWRAMREDGKAPRKLFVIRKTLADPHVWEKNYRGLAAGLAELAHSIAPTYMGINMERKNADVFDLEVGDLPRLYEYEYMLLCLAPVLAMNDIWDGTGPALCHYLVCLIVSYVPGGLASINNAYHEMAEVDGYEHYNLFYLFLTKSDAAVKWGLRAFVYYLTVLDRSRFHLV